MNIQQAEIIWLLKQRVQQLRKAALKANRVSRPKPLVNLHHQWPAPKPVLPEPTATVPKPINIRRALIKEKVNHRIILRCQKCWIGFVITHRDMIRRAVAHYKRHQQH